jgi:hypothetical protein
VLRDEHRVQLEHELDGLQRGVRLQLVGHHEPVPRNPDGLLGPHRRDLLQPAGLRPLG